MASVPPPPPPPSASSSSTRSRRFAAGMTLASLSYFLLVSDSDSNLQQLNDDNRSYRSLQHESAIDGSNNDPSSTPGKRRHTRRRRVLSAEELMPIIDPSAAAVLPDDYKSPSPLEALRDEDTSIFRQPRRLFTPPQEEETSQERRAHRRADTVDVDSHGHTITTATSTSTPPKTNPAAPTAPLVWIHVPHSGTTFLQTLLWTVCSSWPSDWSIQQYTGKALHKYFERYSIPSHCPEGLVEEHGQPDFHMGVGSPSASNNKNNNKSNPLYDKHMGNLVAMFRRPEHRVADAFTSQNALTRGFVDATDLQTYKQHAAGCITKTLTRDDRYPCLNEAEATEDEVKLASQRLKEGFSYVGLTEEWNLSICLWHATYGGTPYVEEFQRYQPVVVGSRPSEKNRKEAPADGSHFDHADEAVYRSAEEVFWSNLDRHGMTSAKCAEMMENAASRADLSVSGSGDEEGEIIHVIDLPEGGEEVTIP